MSARRFLVNGEAARAIRGGWSLHSAPRGDGEGKPAQRLWQAALIADYADNPGAGAYSDDTTLLRAMIEANLSDAALHAICDPEAVQEAQAAGVGNTVTLRLGGKVDGLIGGGQLTVTGQVAAITDGEMVLSGPVGGGMRRSYGLSLLLRVGGIEVIVISHNGQAIDLAQFTSLGVDPTRKSTIAVGLVTLGVFTCQGHRTSPPRVTHIQQLSGFAQPRPTP